MPTKQTINLALVEEKKISLLVAIPAILAIIALAALFGKFMVADRLIEMSEAASRTAQLEKELSSALEKAGSFGDIEDTYAHYTFTGMTKEEMDLVDRVAVVDLVKTVLTTGDTQKTWSVSGNVLTIEITGDSLEEINKLSSKIEESPIVDSCTITTATKEIKETAKQTTTSTSRRTSSSSRSTTHSISKKAAEVRAKYIVYLQQPEEEKEEKES